MTLVKPLSPDPNNPKPSTKTLENSQNSTSKPDKELSAEISGTTPATGRQTRLQENPFGRRATASGNNASSNTGSGKGSNTGIDNHSPGESNNRIDDQCRSRIDHYFRKEGCRVNRIFS